MPTLDDLVAGSSEKKKEELQQALLDLLKGNPDILSSVTKSTPTQAGGHSGDRTEVPSRSGDEDDGTRAHRSPSASFPELDNHLNQQPRASYQWQLSDSDDGIDSAWTTATKNMSPHELCRWRRRLFSVYVGHLPCDITKKELVQLFSEVGSVQDIHLQPAKERGFTYGFIRFCTLDECRDAVSMLHGRLLGNRTITVEYACETKERLQGGDPSDLPLDKKDKLLRNDFPKLERSNRPMSGAESQEKIILWKLRSSATKQMSSPAGFMKEGSKEELMSKIQEIVKKVASLPADTFAVPSGSEGSPCSSWILKEINGNHVHDESGQSSLVQFSDRHQEQYTEVLSHSGTQVNDAAPVATMSHSPTLDSSRNKTELVQRQMLADSQVQASEVKTVNFSPPPNTQRIGHGSFEGNLPPGIPTSPGREESSQSELETTASDSVSLSSLSPERPIRQHCQYCHGLSPTRGHASESSQSENTSSSSSRHSPLSPCTFCHRGEEMVDKGDGIHTLAGHGIGSDQYGGEPLRKNVQNKDGTGGGSPTGIQFKDMGLCSFDCNNDYYFSKNSDVGKEYQKQMQLSSEVPQLKQASMPNQYTSQGLMGVSNQANTSFSQLGLNDPPYPKNTDLKVQRQNQTPYSSEIPQYQQASMPSQYTNKEPTHVASQANRSFVQQGSLSDSPETRNTSLSIHRQADRSFTPQLLLSDPLDSKNDHLLGETQKRSQFSASRETIQEKQVSVPTQHAQQEPMHFTNQLDRQPAHHPLLSDPLHTKSTHYPEESQKQGQYPSEIIQQTQASMPSQPVQKGPMHVNNPSNRPSAYQPLLDELSHTKNTHFLEETKKRRPYPSEITQRKQVSMPSQHAQQEQMHGTKQANKPSAQQGLSEPSLSENTGFPQEGQECLLEKAQKQTQYPSTIPTPKQASMPSQYTNQEPMHVTIQANRSSVQQGLSEPPHSKNTGLPKESQKHTQCSPEIPQQKQASLPGQFTDQELRHFANQAIRPSTQQALFNDPPSLLGQPQHLQAMLANLVASGWQQSGFPRHPFLPPGVINPRIFQELNRTAFLQQQLLASRLQFGPPFRPRGYQTWPRVGFGARGPVPRPGVGCQMPVGRPDVHPVGRGRTFAPRFPHHGAESINTNNDSEKSVSGVSSTIRLEKSLPVGKNILEPCDDKVQSSSFTTGDLQESNVRPPATPNSSQNSNLESTGKELAMGSPTADSLEERNIKPSATPSPEKYELKRIVRENDRLRQSIDWRSTNGVLSKDEREAIKAQIHLKEVQLQKEKEMILARKAEQELLYEREKLEAAFDQQLKKELEIERQTGETRNKIHLAKLENELLSFYQDLHGTKQTSDSAVVADEKRC